AAQRDITGAAGAVSAEALTVRAADIEAGVTVEVSVEVANTGDVAGSETVQLYLQASRSTITRRVLELKAFRKLPLAPGERTTVTFALGKAELAIWNRHMQFAVEPCHLRVLVGMSAASAQEVAVHLV
ncbi:fibronectin type III-like domain-contianing protein, partial [Paenibacillus sp. 598K]|uniref:fibronectin type III-like domain-contianing protein n=1 Tax=Paenibacillus sp. 598K TaxID=1117987 RepID=UPI0021AA1559